MYDLKCFLKLSKRLKKENDECHEEKLPDASEFVNHLLKNKTALSRSNVQIEELKRNPKLRSACIEPSYIDLEKCGSDIWIGTAWVKPGYRTDYMTFTLDHFD